MGAAFTVQVTLGYFLMLAAMTYQGELFIAVVAGLGAGHMLLNVTQPVGETTDACCVEGVTIPPRGLTATRTNDAEAAEWIKEEGGGAGGVVVRLHVAPVVCQRCVEQTTAALVGLKGVSKVHVAADGTTSLMVAAGESQAPVTARAIAAVVAIGKTATESSSDAAI